MIGLRPCTYARAYVDPVFTSQAKRKTNLSVYSGSYAYAYVAAVFTCLHMCLCLCLCLRVSENHASNEL